MKRVITYGTFDLFHKGHRNILKRAKELGDYLIVGVTGENYDAERGKLSVQDSLATRIENVRKTGYADEIIVEEYDGQKINDIIKYKADILVLGLDWKGKFDHLKKYCDVIYLERTKDISSTQLREKNNRIYNYGILTDHILPNDFIFDAEYVSGIHIESIFSENLSIAETICDNLHIDRVCQNYDEFLKTSDIIYVNCELNKRYEYIKKAILEDKHVVSNSPMSLEPCQVEELFSLAKEHNVVLLDDIPTVYVRTFNQLLSIARGQVIGDLLSVKCSLSLEQLPSYNHYSRYDIFYYIVCFLMNILGEDYETMNFKSTHNQENVIYDRIEFEYLNSIGYGEFSQNIHNSSFVEIIGTKGKISMPYDWWKAAYFEVELYAESNVRRYCTNFEGNGFRYLIQVMLQMIKENRLESQRLSPEDSIRIVNILKQMEL